MNKSSRATRMGRRHKRRTVGALNLVSLMDIFTILVFFLLVNSSDVQELPNSKSIQLPESIAEQKARETVVIMITSDAILVQGKEIALVDEVMAKKGNLIVPLQMALREQNDRILRQATAEDIAGREVTIMGDKEIPYRLLKKVMATCTKAEFGRISLAVIQKSGQKPA